MDEMPPYIPDADQPGLAHDLAGDVWARHAAGPRRDREADAEIREAIRREQDGEYDADGNFIPSTWKPA